MSPDIHKASQGSYSDEGSKSLFFWLEQVVRRPQPIQAYHHSVV